MTGFQSTTCATKDTLVMPRVVARGLSGGSHAPRGWVFVFRPVGLVGEVCFLVRP